MELYIDNRPVELAGGSAAAVTLSVAAVTDPERLRAGYTRTLRVAMGGAADAVMGHAADPNAAEHFNAAPHVGRVEHEGAVLIEGTLYLSGAVAGSHYEVHIIGGAKRWAESASGRRLSQTGLAYSGRMTPAAIAAGWTNADAVKFLPVVRRGAKPDYSSGTVIPAMRMMTADDYHPFVRCAALVEAIFADGGYTVDSQFLKSAEFASLYASGNYPTRDVALLKDRMDFVALRPTDRTAAADYNGRVYADPNLGGQTLGNLVDAAADGSFSNGGCVRMEGKRVAFVPTGEVQAGFAYRLKYTTDARILTRTKMRGFDQVSLYEPSGVRRFTLANPYPDRRNELRGVGVYKVCVFDHAAGREYQMQYDRLNAAGGVIGGVNSFVGRDRFNYIEFPFPDTATLTSPVLQYRNGSTGAWADYSGDWAIYDGFVTETSSLDVDITIRSAPETVTVGSAKYFDKVFFGGADEGMTITLRAGTSVAPVFYAQPGENSQVGFADVFAHSASQMDFLRAMRQMFGLVFVTDQLRRIVTIEPIRTFYIAENPTMWTSRIDRRKPIRVEELGGELAKQMTWSYRTGDDAVARFNRDAGGQLGRWTAQVENAAAGNVSRVWENPLFTPSVTARGVVGGAPSAAVIQAGEDAYLSGTDSLNFLPKIVRYEGMKALPAGEVWGWPSAGTSYPKAAFHAPESGYTLCFEDRDGVRGLHAGWEADLRLWNSSRRVTLFLRLNAAEVEQADFRRLVSLEIDGETALYRLEEIVDYNPDDDSTKCVFIKHIP